jgi:hypothetical protein
MMFWRCLVLCVLVACGSKHDTGGEAKPGDPPTVKQPAAPKPVAIAFVFEGLEMWVGNDEIHAEDDPSRMLGVLKSFKEAFKRVALKDLPAGSKATVVTYTDHASVRRPMGPIETLTADAFGEQKDYAGAIDRNLVSGVTLGLDELKKVTDARRILVVIGDGTDEKADAAKVALAALAQRAAAENVEVQAIIYKGELSQPGHLLAPLDPEAVTANSMDAIAEQLNWSIARLAHPPLVAPPGGPPPPFTLAILLADQEVWMGNDDITPPEEEASRYKGALNAIRGAFERSPMTGFPAGSQAMLITYDDKAKTKIPLTPIESLDARAIGNQKDYYRKVGTELVTGVRHAFTELAKLQGGRRVLIILGDGNDTNNEAAKTQLGQLAKQAAELHIEVYALVWKGPLSDNGSVITVLDPKATTSATTDELAADLVSLFRVLRNR